jgi:hypothetical protein
MTTKSKKTSKKSAKTKETTPAPAATEADAPEATAPELSPEEIAQRNEMVTFVANNILNNLTLNNCVTIVQQIALRDAQTIVRDSDEKKFEEIVTAMEAQKKAAAEAAEAQNAPAPGAEEITPASEEDPALEPA